MKYSLLQTRRKCFPTPFGIPMGDILSNRCKDILLGNYGRVFGVYKDGVASWYGDVSKIHKVDDNISKYVMKHPKHAFNVFNKFIKEGHLTLDYAKSIKSVDKKSNEELLIIFKELMRLYYELYPFSEPLAYAVREFFFEYLKKTVSSEVFDVLITPLEESFLSKENKDLLKISSEKNQGKDIEQKLKKHAEKYAWIEYDYGIRVLSEKDFRKRLKNIKNAKKELEKIKKSENELKQKQKKYAKYDNDMFKVARLAAYMMDHKKEVFTQVHYYSRGLMVELGKRLGLNFDLVQFLMPDEIEKALLGMIKVDKKEVQQRYDFSLIEWDGKGSYRQIVGKEAKHIFEIISSENDYSKIVELKGTVASPGKVKGKVRVITDPKDIGKLKKGEVLVAIMTSPDYIVAMKKAAAIVTDEGGLTTHAAIVSRELKVPCIVGTKIATKVLKDGDLVEVDAVKGVVKKI